jgi:CheY-like chemotaxis protein
MQEPSAEETKSKGTILCADDHSGLLELLDALLTSTGYCTVLARDGDEAIALFKQHQQDLVAVVLDLRMPKKDGIAVAREIRTESAEIPIIALSAYLTGSQGEGVRKQCEEAGFTAYTRKPFAVESFLKTLEDCIGRYARRPQDR